MLFLFFAVCFWHIFDTMTPENFMDENLEKRFEQLADERIENKKFDTLQPTLKRMDCRFWKQARTIVPLYAFNRLPDGFV